MAEILEENDKLLGDFIGWKPVKTWMGVKGYVFQEAKFKTDWNWLMSVVDKISKLHSIPGLYKEYSKVTDALFFIDISILYPAVVEFVKWYNSQELTA